MTMAVSPAAPTANLLLEAALAYTARGWPVLPLHGTTEGRCTCGNATCGKSAGKHPRIVTGKEHEAASTDPATVRGWWSRWPDSNVGIVTGPASGLVVLDVDGDAGLQTLAQLEQRLGSMPPTLCSRTGSGGFHYLFRHPGEGHRVVNRAHSLGRCLDIRGNGGLFVLPPSAHRSGRGYEWIACDGVELAPFDWLGRALELADQDRAATPAANVVPFRQPEREQVLRRAAAYLQKMSPAVSGEHGHDTTWSAALAVIRGFGLSTDEGYGLLAQEYNPRCAPPWSERELRHKVESAAADARTPWGYLLLADRTRAERSGPQPVPDELPDPPAWLDEVPPLGEPPGDRPSAGRTLLGFLPATGEVARWLGSQAGKEGKAEEIAKEIPEGLLSEWRAGIEVGEGGTVLSRPEGITTALYQRVRRYLKHEEQEILPTDPEAALGVRVVRLVRRPVLDRATYDLTLEHTATGVQAELRRLVGADLGSYKTVRDRAIEAGLVLLPPGKRTKGAWNDMLATAVAAATVETLDPEESITFAIREQIREILANTDRGETQDELRRGKVVIADGCVYILPKWLVSQARLKLQDDHPERVHIIDAAASLGMRELRPLLEKDGSRPRVWAFPWPLQED